MDISQSGLQFKKKVKCLAYSYHLSQWGQNYVSIQMDEIE